MECVQQAPCVCSCAFARVVPVYVYITVYVCVSVVHFVLVVRGSARVCPEGQAVCCVPEEEEGEEGALTPDVPCCGSLPAAAI